MMKPKVNFVIRNVIISLFLIANIVIVASTGVVNVRSGAIVHPGENICFEYFIFNSDPVNDQAVELSVTGELEEIFVPSSGSKGVVPANTLVESPYGLNVCFNIPSDIYDDDQDCLGPEREYNGHIIVSDIKNEGSNEGSSVSVGTAIPLKLLVECDPDADDGRGFNLVSTMLLSVIILLVLVIVVLVVIRYKKDHERIKTEQKISKDNSRTLSTKKRNK